MGRTWLDSEVRLGFRCSHYFISIRRYAIYVAYICPSTADYMPLSPTANPSLTAIFPSHHGLLHIHTLPAPHTILSPSDKFSTLRGLSSSAVSTSGSGENNLAFKCMRKRLVFETLHLDVEGGVGERRTTPATNAFAMDAAIMSHDHDHDHDLERPKADAAAIQVEVEAYAKGNDMPDADGESVQASPISVKAKKPKKKVAFHSDRPDLYDF